MSSRNGKSKSAFDGQHITYVDARKLKPSPENDHIYRCRTDEDPDFVRLVHSVKEHGVQTPLLVSLDEFVISGHQRRRAAICSGRFEVPVLYLRLSRFNHTADAWTAILREHNTGREKSFDELVREKLIDVDPDEAVALIADDKVKRCKPRIGTIDIGTRRRKRCGISDGKQEMFEAVIDVLKEMVEYLPISLRAVHYRLLARTFFRHTGKKTKYLNNRECYQDLSKLVVRMRLNGDVAWEAIGDETRPFVNWRVWPSGADFMNEQLNELFKDFALDLLCSQQMHFEIVAEKLTVQNFIRPVAMRYTMPYLIGRGNSSLTSRHAMVERFEASGKDKLFLFCLGDCDPDGDSIVETTLQSLRDDFGLEQVNGVRVAMTHVQADALNLPRTLDAKESSSNYKKFKEKHRREDCYELEAVSPEQLQTWLDEAIRSVIDIEAYNYEVDRQTTEATKIVARRKAIIELMKNHNLDQTA